MNDDKLLIPAKQLRILLIIEPVLMGLNETSKKIKEIGKVLSFLMIQKINFSQYKLVQNDKNKIFYMRKLILQSELHINIQYCFIKLHNCK